MINWREVARDLYDSTGRPIDEAWRSTVRREYEALVQNAALDLPADAPQASEPFVCDGCNGMGTQLVEVPAVLPPPGSARTRLERRPCHACFGTGRRGSRDGYVFTLPGDVEPRDVRVIETATRRYRTLHTPPWFTDCWVVEEKPAAEPDAKWRASTDSWPRLCTCGHHEAQHREPGACRPCLVYGCPCAEFSTKAGA